MTHLVETETLSPSLTFHFWKLLLPRFFLLLLFLNPLSCSLFQESHPIQRSFGPREKVFFSSYEKVWRAVQISLRKYPMKVNNMNIGYLETDTIKGDAIWKAPITDRPSAGIHYKIIAKVIKGSIDKSKVYKVTILKDISFQKDFFSDTESIPSDGLEEASILYRIGRELKIEKAIEREQNKKDS